MFFALSKILAFLLKPLNWILGWFLFGWLSNNARWKMRGLGWAFGLFAVFTNPWLVNQCVHWWETGHCSMGSLDKSFSVGIVLGGYLDLDAETPKGLVTFHRAGNRLTTALALYKSGKIRRILLSGGDGRLLGSVASEAQVARTYLLQVGIPDTCILLEDRSRNTRENAVLSRQVLDRATLTDSCLLITSAWHMRRALACFKQAGVSCAPFATDFLTERHPGNPFQWLEPDWKALMKWDALLKEWAGYVMYRMHSYV